MSAPTTLVRVMLPSTNEVVYDMSPVAHRLDDEDGLSLHERARLYGIWKAVRIGAEWYDKAPGGGLRRITDPHVCYFLQTAREA